MIEHSRKTLIGKTLVEAQIEAYCAGIKDTYDALGLNELLSQGKTFNEVSEAHHLNREATERFLNACVSIGLAYKSPSGKYITSVQQPIYSAQPLLDLFWVLENKIPDLLKDKPLTLAEINAKLHIDCADKLESAVTNGIIAKTEKNQYVLIDDTRKYYLSNSPNYIEPMLSFSQMLIFPFFCAKGLIGALKTGGPQWGKIFGKHVSCSFDLYRGRQDLIDTFSEGMHKMNSSDNKEHAALLTVDHHEILDLGGGSGGFALRLLENGSKHTKIDIYELPEAIPQDNKILHKYAPDENRINYVAGSFLDSPNEPYLSGLSPEKKYDYITLGWILHDWDDESCITILKKARSHLKPNGQVIILEYILPENKIGPPWIHIADLTMLFHNIKGSRERTLDEFKILFKKAGFKTIKKANTKTRRQLISAEG